MIMNHALDLCAAANSLGGHLNDRSEVINPRWLALIP